MQSTSNVSSFLNYPGAKWRIAEWIVSFIPEHHSYLEPFFGSGAVFFSKAKSNIETINDLDGDVVNLFECVREDPEKLARIIYFTPYSREEYYQSYSRDTSDRFDMAARFIIRCNMGYGFRTSGGRVGWKRDVAGREKAYSAKAWSNLPDIIIDVAGRLRGVQIERTSAVDLIANFNSPGVLIYCDPPYLLSTRYGKQYRCEMTENDHLQLLDVLKKHKGPALISGYQSDMYDAELREWHKEITLTTDRRCRVREEVLWMNFEPMVQTTIFNKDTL